MKRSFLASLSIILIAVLFHSTAFSEEKEYVIRSLVAEMEKTVVNEKGEKKTIRVPAATIIPGDEVIYTITFVNVSDKDVENLVILDAVPEHMFYKDGSASGDSTVITFSIDGGKTYDTPENLKVTGEDGKERQAEPSEYTDIRWALKNTLKPGEDGKVEFTAELE